MASSSTSLPRIRRDSGPLADQNRGPIRLNDPFYGFAARTITGIVSLVSVTTLSLAWGALNGWTVTNRLLYAIFFLVFFIVFLGEHIRSRSFERTYNKDRLRFDDDFRTSTQEKSSTEKQPDRIDKAEVRSPSVNTYKLNAGKYLKRLFESSYSAVGLFLLFPLLFGVAVAIIVEDGGPIFVRYRYELLNGKTVTITSFRTYKVSSSVEWETTLVGKYIRKTSIDVLPRLFDVVLGKISLWGPLGIGTYSRYRDDLRAAGVNCNLKPAIAGYSTLAIMRREARSGKPDLSSRTAVALVAAYERNWSFGKDLALAIKIVRATIFAGVFPRKL